MKSLTRHFAMLPMVCALACGGGESLPHATVSVALGSDERPTTLDDANATFYTEGDPRETCNAWVRPQEVSDMWVNLRANDNRFRMAFRNQIGKQDCTPMVQEVEGGTLVSLSMEYGSTATGVCGRLGTTRCEVDVQAVPGEDGGSWRGTFSALLECSGGKPALELKNGTFELRCPDVGCFVPLSQPGGIVKVEASRD